MQLSPTNETQRDATDALIARVRGMPRRRRQRMWLWPSAMFIAFFAVTVWLGAAGYFERVWPVFAALALTFGTGIWIWMRAERRELRTVKELAACQEIR